MQYSIVDISKARQSHPDFRFEPEFFHPLYLSIENKLKNEPSLSDVSNSIVCGPFGSNILDKTYKKSGVKVIRPFNIKSCQIENENIVFISKEDVKNKKLKLFRRGTIFFARVGDVKCGIFLDDIQATISPNIIAVEIDVKKCNSYFITIFFNCFYGLKQLERHRKITNQPTISTGSLSVIKLPLVSNNFMQSIEQLFKDAIILDEMSNDSYKGASTFLLSQLGLDGWQPNKQLSFVANYSETANSNRIDADYFQPHYKEIENAIYSYAGGFSSVGAQFNQNLSNPAFQLDDDYKYVEIGSISVSSGEISPSILTGANLPANAKRKLRKGEVIISKVRTYRGGMAIVPEDGLIGSGAFTVLSEKGCIAKEVLYTFLRSAPLLHWSLKPNTGTSYPVIHDADILNLPVPLFDKQTQSKICQMIQESRKQKTESKRLLDVAKRAVEIAIEQDEAAAFQFIEAKTS